MISYNEPWRLQHGRDITDEGYSVIVDCNGKPIDDDHDERKIECVNALTGVPYPERLPELLKAIAEIVADYDPDTRLAVAYRAMMGEMTLSPFVYRSWVRLKQKAEVQP